MLNQQPFPLLKGRKRYSCRWHRVLGPCTYVYVTGDVDNNERVCSFVRAHLVLLVMECCRERTGGLE